MEGHLFPYEIMPPEFYEKNVKKKDIKRVMTILKEINR